MTAALDDPIIKRRLQDLAEARGLSVHRTEILIIAEPGEILDV